MSSGRRENVAICEYRRVSEPTTNGERERERERERKRERARERKR